MDDISTIYAYLLEPGLFYQYNANGERMVRSYVIVAVLKLSLCFNEPSSQLTWMLPEAIQATGYLIASSAHSGIRSHGNTLHYRVLVAV